MRDQGKLILLSNCTPEVRGENGWGGSTSQSSTSQVMGDSIGLETDLGKESLIACLFAGLGAGTLLSGGLADPF
eukprot:4961092-Amphidinium_carterae.1